MANEKEPVSVLELPLKMEKWQADRINSVMDAVTKIYNIVLRKTNNRYKELIKTKAWRADTTRLVDLYNIQKSTEDAVKEQRSYLNKILKKETENLPDDDPNKEKIIADKSQKLEEEIEAFEQKILELKKSFIENYYDEFEAISGDKKAEKKFIDKLNKKLEGKTKARKFSDEEFEDAFIYTKAEAEKKVIYDARHEQTKFTTPYGISDTIKPVRYYFSNLVPSAVANITISEPMGKAFEKLIYGNGKRVYYRKFNETNTICSNNKSGLRVVEENGEHYLLYSCQYAEGEKNAEKQAKREAYQKENKIKPYKIRAKYNKSHEMRIKIGNPKTKYETEMLKAKIARVTLVRKFEKTKYHYYIQLTLKREPYIKVDENGEPLHKVKDGVVGINIWRNRLCAVSKTEAKVFDLSPGYIEKSKLQADYNRKLDELSRAENPDNYNEDGTVKKGTKGHKLTWSRSDEWKFYKRKLSELYRVDNVNKDYNRRKIVYALLEMGNEFIMMDSSNITKKIGVTEMTNKEQEKAKDRRSSIQEASPSAFVNALNARLNSYGLPSVKKVKINEELYWYNAFLNKIDKTLFTDDAVRISDIPASDGYYLEVPHTLYRAFMLLHYDNKKHCYLDVSDEELDNFVEITKEHDILLTNKKKRQLENA